jgi:hypothetical protein
MLFDELNALRRPIYALPGHPSRVLHGRQRPVLHRPKPDKSG